MEDSEKVEIVEKNDEEKDTKSEVIEEHEQKNEEKSVKGEEFDAVKPDIEESIAESRDIPEQVIAEVIESSVNEPTESESNEKVQEEVVVSVSDAKTQEEEEEDPPIIEECDTGGDEVPDVLTEPSAIIPVLVDAEAVPANEKSGDEPVLLAELTSAFVPDQEQQVESSGTKPASDVVSLEDDDDDGGYAVDDVDDSEDPGEEEDDDVENVSNEALNDDDEEDDDDDEYLYGEEEHGKKETKSSREALDTEELDDDYDEDDDDDDDMLDMKEDSNGAVVIGSSDEDEPVPRAMPKETQKPQLQPKQVSQSRQLQEREIDRNEDIELDYDDLDDEDEEEDEDEDEYDDDDLMNAVVTSAAKSLSPPKKRPRSVSPVAEARRREAHQISALRRRKNYCRIAKKKSLQWFSNKKIREAYKLILPNHKTRKDCVSAMRSDQSGGLLHLKISSPAVSLIDQKSSSIKASTPIKPHRGENRPGPASRTKPKPECVIDLDSSPEKTQDKVIPRQYQQTNEPQKLEFDLKKPPDSEKVKEEIVEEEPPVKMQQTDKVRDSIQKSTEEVEEVKTAVVDRLKCEQNKENLQSNDVLPKSSEEVVTKVETEVKDVGTHQEEMDTSENETNESTIKAASISTTSATPVKIDIKEEKPDKETPAAATADEVSVASKVTIEDVPETEATAPTQSESVGNGGVTNKRRRSSSNLVSEKTKIPKTAAGTAEANQDEEEEYVHPTKKLREELQNAYPAHDRILNEYIEKTSNDSIDTIQRHIDQMVSEINTLNDMIKAKELEWNNMLNLKKVKEEICYRLTRRKQCMEIMSTKVGEAGRSAGLDEDYVGGNDSAIILGKSTPAAKQNIQLSSTPIQAAINSLSSNICNFTAVSSSSSATPTTAQLIVQNRANMKSSDLVKEKANTLRLHRNILPKPNTASPNTSNTSGSSNQHSQHQQQQNLSTNGPTSAQPNASNQPILNSYLTSTDSVQQLVDMMNGHHNHNALQNGGTAASNSQAAAAAMVGRQGPFKDVRSIIADFRQQHPEVVPRRGRRVKTNNNSNLSDSNTILGNALKSDTNSRPSSNDSSSQSNTNQVTTNHNSVNSFKDVLAPFSKSQGAVRSAGGQQQNPPYPEVTLHPVSTPLNASGGQDQPTGSLLHGILTKFSRPSETTNNKSVSANYISNFSPTLARLLTAPERISPSGAGSGALQSHHNSSVGDSGNASGHHSMPNFGVNLSKVVGHNSEITITPVLNSMHQQSILQQQLQQQQIKDAITRAVAAVGHNNSVKEEHFMKISSFAAPSAPNNDDDAEDSVDRLVIDEGDLMGGDEHQRIAPHAIGQEFNENEVPVCQGCKKHEAQFVCAGCGNQWYCSRECQVTAWDDHSEVCTG